MRKRIFQIIEVAEESDRASAVYDCIMLITIVVSMIPLMFKETTTLFITIDKITVTLFIIDYLLRWMTADFKLGSSSPVSFIKYPFTFMALVDLISILPSVTLLSNTFKLFRVFKVLKLMRLMRTFRVFRVFKAARYSKALVIIGNVFRNSKEALAAVGTLAIIYVIVSALVVFNIEPETFETFFDAVYWAAISLTTVGYGDVYCVTTVGKVVTMISSVFGIAIVALPAGIITAGYIDELQKRIHEKRNEEKR